MNPAAEPDPTCFALDSGWRGEVLRTARLTLRRILPADAEWVAALAGDWEVARHTRIPHPLTVDGARAFIADKSKGMDSGEAVVLVLERTADGQPIGVMGLHRDGGAAEIGYWVARAEWGKGYATEALRRLLRLAFRNLGLARVEAEVATANPASARSLEKCGFTVIRASSCCETRGERLPSQRWGLERAAWEAAWAARPTMLVAAVALVDVDNRVLLAQRPEGRMMAGLWEFPGGKLHPGETPEQALVRELEEELGIDVRQSCLAPFTFASHDYDTFHLLMPLYLCRSWKGAVTPREGQRLAWARPVRLGDYPMPPADLPLAAMLRDWL